MLTIGPMEELPSFQTKVFTTTKVPHHVHTSTGNYPLHIEAICWHRFKVISS